MKELMKNIFLTIVVYVLDVIIWGSIVGFIYVIGFYSSNILLGTDYNLITSYFKGIVVYWIADTIVAKFREAYKIVTEDKKDY